MCKSAINYLSPHNQRSFQQSKQPSNKQALPQLTAHPELPASRLVLFFCLAKKQSLPYVRTLDPTALPLHSQTNEVRELGEGGADVVHLC